MSRKVFFIGCVLILSILMGALREDVSLFRERRARVMKTLSDGLTVVLSAKLSTTDFNRNAKLLDLYYLTGYERSDAVLFLVPREQKSMLFIPTLTTQELQHLKAIDAADEYVAIDTMSHTMRARIQDSRKLYHQEYLELEDLFEWVKEANAELELIPRVGAVVGGMRLRKSPSELASLVHAAQATSYGLNKSIKTLRSGMNEMDLATIIEKGFREKGCSGSSFPLIIASGANGLILHYTKNDSPLKDGDLVICDVGGTYQGYASDLCRTLPVNGVFSDEQRMLYRHVLEAQKRCERVLQPGVSLQELQTVAEAYFEEHDYAKYFTHLIGHHVGLSVHDRLFFDTKLEPGMVITIEPGLYINDRQIGIRIEDTYIITEGGFERITTDVPREMNEIETFMSTKQK